MGVIHLLIYLNKKKGVREELFNRNCKIKGPSSTVYTSLTFICIKDYNKFKFGRHIVRRIVDILKKFIYILCMEMKLEVVTVPVADVDRAKKFYIEKLGFHEDGDWKIEGGRRYIQLTPVGSGCSIVLGEGITTAKPGSIDSLLLVVKDIHEAHDELVKKGVTVTDVEKMPWGAWHIYMSDPDGNKLSIQQKPPRP